MSNVSVEAKVLHKTSSLCPACKQGVPAEIVEQGGRIIMHKRCATHGESKVLVSSSAEWYHDVMSYPAVLKAPTNVKREVEAGCPFDCGACTSHQQQVYLPVIPITSACNLDCPICYTINKNQAPYNISLKDFSAILDQIRRNDPRMTLINLTGGEPTLHPQLREIVGLCHDAGIHRVTLSTHGLTFIKDESLLRDLAALKVRVVLSFDSFDEDINQAMLGAKLGGAKLKVLDQLAKHGVDTTLIPVLALGCNDKEVGKLVDLTLERDCIRSLEIHTMTFTGQGGTAFEPSARITTPDVLKLIEEHSSGRIAMKDFVPSPCAHPLCYQTCYLLGTASEGWVPFNRFMSKAQVRHLLTDNLYMEPGPKLEGVLKDCINELWSSEKPSPQGEAVLTALKKVMGELFPHKPLPYAEQQIISERSAKTIYLHSHMDEESFDTDRIRQCCVGVPEADGGNTPTCSYNILYRGRDGRFSQKAAAMPPLSGFSGGRTFKDGH